MIQARIQQEENSQILINRKDKLLSKLRARGQTTLFTITKRHSIQQSVQVSPPSKPKALSPDGRTRENQHCSPENVERTCSNFMKNYVEKLKKQRKREKKRLNQINQNKYYEKESGMGWDIAPLPLIHNGHQQILILQRINPGSFKSVFMQPTPSTSTLENEKIEEIMHEIRIHRQKIARENMRRGIKKGLPIIQKQKSQKKQKMVSLQSLDPWQAEHGHHDSLFDQFK